MALVAGAIVLGRPSPDARGRKAAILLTLMAAYYGLRGYAHHRALDIVPRVFGPTLAPWCDPDESRDRAIDSWPRREKGETPSPPPEGKRCLVDVAALPAFGSALQWRLLPEYSNAYDVR